MLIILVVKLVTFEGEWVVIVWFKLNALCTLILMFSIFIVIMNLSVIVYLIVFAHMRLNIRLGFDLTRSQ